MKRCLNFLTPNNKIEAYQKAFATDQRHGHSDGVSNINFDVSKRGQICR